MARTGRSRQRSTDGPSGVLVSQFGSNPTEYKYSTTLKSYDTCNDHVGFPVKDSDMKIVSREWDITPVNGGYEASGGSFGVAADYMPPTLRSPNGSYVVAASTGWALAPSASDATTAAARSNPNRPEVIPGELIRDLVDLPKMIRGVGNALREGRSAIGVRGVANRALAAKFGWAPLFHDIALLMDLQARVDNRHREINKLFSEGGLRRRLRLDRKVRHDSGRPTIASGFPTGTSKASWDRIDTSTKWATIRWKAKEPNPFKTYSDERRTVIRIVHGATASGAFASAWDLLPWTWIYNWFGNTRDYVLAHGNTIPVYLADKINCMLTNEQVRTVHNLSWGQGSWDGGEVTARHVWKVRDVRSNVAHETHMPYLSKDRLSTLSLLAIQRLRH